MFLSLLTKKWKGFLFWAVSFLLVSLLPVFSMRETTTLVTFFITDAWAFPVSLIGGPLYLVLFLGGEFLRLFFMGTSADLSYAMALAKAVGALAGWWICKKIRFNAKLPTLRDVLIFFAIVSFVVLPIAGLLTAALSLAFNSQLGFLYHFLNVYMGAIIPLEVFGAVYLVFATHPKWSMSDIFVSLALFLGTAALSMFVLGRFFAFGYASIEIMIVLVPLALVVGLKRGLLGAAAFHLGLTVAFIETSASGFGPFQINLIPNSVGALIMFVNGLLTLNFMISALFLENQEARRSVEAFDKKKSRFLLMLSHEMRTPLNGILGTAEILKGSPLSPGQISKVETIIRTGRQLDQWTLKILEFLQSDAEDPSFTIPESLPAPAPDHNSATYADIKVLVVEDNPLNLEITRRFLSFLGVASDPAANGKEALDQLAHHSYDLILMDLTMPVMDGYETARRIRENENGKQHQIIVALTAHALSEEKVRALDAGMDDFITKPLRKEALAQTINKWRSRPPFAPPPPGSSSPTGKLQNSKC